MTSHPNRSAANAHRVIRRHISVAGYSRKHVDYGISWAEKIGYASTREGFILAVSRILYDDAALADGSRFAVEVGHGPR